MTQIQPSRSPVPPAPQSDDAARVRRAIDLAQELFEAPTVTGAKFVGCTNKDSAACAWPLTALLFPSRDES